MRARYFSKIAHSVKGEDTHGRRSYYTEPGTFFVERSVDTESGGRTDLGRLADFSNAIPLLGVPRDDSFVSLIDSWSSCANQRLVHDRSLHEESPFSRQLPAEEPAHGGRRRGKTGGIATRRLSVVII